MHHMTEYFMELGNRTLFLHKGMTLTKVSDRAANDKFGTTHVISGNPKVKVVAVRGRKSKSKKTKWRHDAWTFAALHDRYAKTEHAMMLKALAYLQCGLTPKQVSHSLGLKVPLITNWAKRYAKDGLAVMLGVDSIVPHMFAKRIDAYVRNNPNSLRKILCLSGESLIEMAEEIQVEDYALERWALLRLIGD